MHKYVNHLTQNVSPILVKQAIFFADLPAKLIKDLEALEKAARYAQVLPNASLANDPTINS